jgi:hypothetical protein
MILADLARYGCQVLVDQANLEPNLEVCHAASGKVLLHPECPEEKPLGLDRVATL